MGALPCFFTAKPPLIHHFPSHQALLDAYTIKREIGRLENFKIGMVGDLANGRTVRAPTASLSKTLSVYQGVGLLSFSPR